MTKERYNEITVYEITLYTNIISKLQYRLHEFRITYAQVMTDAMPSDGITVGWLAVYQNNCRWKKGCSNNVVENNPFTEYRIMERFKLFHKQLSYPMVITSYGYLIYT